MQRAVLTFLVGCLVLPAPGWSQGAFRPQVEFGTSLVAGAAHELVLRDQTYHDPISRLVWPIPLSLGLDLTAQLPWTGWTSTRVSVRGLWPVASGTMVDEDWRTGTYTYARSEHPAYLMSHWKVQAEQEFRWDGLRFLLGGQYRWSTWEGWNGQGTYTTESSVTETTFSGLLIAYRQVWYIPYLGLGYRWAGEGWGATQLLRFGPYSWCLDLDNHNYAGSASKAFIDFTRGGLYGQASMEVDFAASAGYRWGIRAGGEVHWGAIGDTTTTYSVASGSGSRQAYPTSLNTAGTWFHEYSLSLFVRE